MLVREHRLTTFLMFCLVFNLLQSAVALMSFSLDFQEVSFVLDLRGVFALDLLQEIISTSQGRCRFSLWSLARRDLVTVTSVSLPMAFFHNQLRELHAYSSHLSKSASAKWLLPSFI
jgi:hypothetical protein